MRNIFPSISQGEKINPCTCCIGKTILGRIYVYVLVLGRNRTLFHIAYSSCSKCCSAELPMSLRSAYEPIIIRLTHANVWESMGKPCSCMQLIIASYYGDNYILLTEIPIITL